jgi:hypothetical protein
MVSSLDLALQRTLSIRLNLQISLSSLPIVEEWMDIHLDRWLEHNPMPPDMPNGQAISYSVMLGTDLRRMWWGAWGDPRGFVPKMADYFKLCNIDKSDNAVLEQIGEALEPTEVGSWIGVWGGKVVTGWHFTDPHEWSKVEAMFGTHEAKYQLKKWMELSKVPNIARFSQAIGDSSYSEIEMGLPGLTVEDQVRQASEAFNHFTGAPLDERLRRHLQEGRPGAGLAVRIRGGKITRVAVVVPGISMEGVERLCADAGCIVDPKFGRVCNAVGDGLQYVAYGRAGQHAGVDVFLEPTEPKGKDGAPAAPPAPSEPAN